MPYQACRNQKRFFFAFGIALTKKNQSSQPQERCEKSLYYQLKILGEFFSLGWLTENFW
jgi:hypothetical protein